VTILSYVKKVYPLPIVILPFSQRKSESTIFGSSRCSDSHEQLMELKKKVKACPGTLLQCTENVAFSLLMNRGGFTKWLSCGLCCEESLLGWSGLRWRMRFFMTGNGSFKKSWASFGNYDRVAWERCLWIVMKSLIAKHQYLRSFDKVWCSQQFIC